MRIIKKGTIPPKVWTVYCGTCHHCSCEFEADETDFKIRTVGGYGQTRAGWVEDGYAYSYVKCPTCGKEIDKNALEEKTVKEKSSKGK